MNVKQEPEWRKSFVLRAYVHNSKLKNAAIRMVFQYWVTYVYSCFPVFNPLTPIDVDLRSCTRGVVR